MQWPASAPACRQVGGRSLSAAVLCQRREARLAGRGGGTAAQPRPCYCGGGRRARRLHLHGRGTAAAALGRACPEDEGWPSPSSSEDQDLTGSTGLPRTLVVPTSYETAECPLLVCLHAALREAVGDRAACWLFPQPLDPCKRTCNQLTALKRKPEVGLGKLGRVHDGGGTWAAPHMLHFSAPCLLS